MKSDRWLPMCSCVWRVCHLIYTSHPAFSWLFILFEATLHTPRKHSYTRRLIPFPPQDASLFWMTWMDVVLSASQRNGIFFRSTSGIWSQGHISDLSLEFLHFSNLKSLYARKTDHSVPIFQLPCSPAPLPLAGDSARLMSSWSLGLFPTFLLASLSPLLFWCTAQTLGCHTLIGPDPQSLPLSCPCPFICSSSKVQSWFHFCSAYPEAPRVNQHLQAVWSAFCVALASP